MSCNGCRILRKGCSDTCILRTSIEWIDGAHAQANATVFVAKFFGRSTLLSFLSSVPLPHRPAAFRSLLYEACGRSINPVNGATGLLWTGNWQLCQAAVETVLGSGSLRSLTDQLADASEVEELYRHQKRGAAAPSPPSSSSAPLRKRRRRESVGVPRAPAPGPAASDIDLCLMPEAHWEEKWRASTPPAASESSVTTTTTTVGSGEDGITAAEKSTLLNLFI
ncbi:hypothetical protein Cni_G19237 [Canna indica]|uniref:LOB domain-containing protein n=1 Tax=Canna indica TaxID=4628 RepID=A0AAQ3KKS2_9LILI|nr:hypothetical protein Cni_G19237 [Canna indica]